MSSSDEAGERGQGLSADGSDAPRELWGGPHLARLDSPDTIFIRFNGELSGPDVVRIHEAIARLRGDRGHLLLLLDMSRLDGILKEARQAAVGPTAPEHLRGMAVIGASFTLRAITTLIMKTYQIFTRSGDAPVAFFDTEAKARAWLAERQRAILRGRANETR